MNDLNLTTEETQINAVDTEKYQSISEAVSAMKDELINDAKQAIACQETMGYPQKLAEAVSEMKDELIKDAQPTIAGQETIG